MKCNVKKLMCTLLSVLMIFSILPGEYVSAVNMKGPDKENGYIAFVNNEKQEWISIFANSKYVETSEVKGASYDEKTNTLTIKNLNLEKTKIEYSLMGSDFKIKVEGKNKIGAIYGCGSHYNGNVTITGKGTLEINKKKVFNYAIVIKSENSASSVTIDKNVTITATATSKSKDSIYIYDDTKIEKASKAIIIKNSSTAGKKAAKNVKSKKVDVIQKCDGFTVYYDKAGNTYIAALGDVPGTYDMVPVRIIDENNFEWLDGEVITCEDPIKAGFSTKVIGKELNFYYKGTLSLKGQK